MRIDGVWEMNPKFGMQFKMQNFETLMPNTEDGIVHYLASGLIKGVGPATAKRIVKEFGLDTFDVLDNDIERLQKLPRISAKIFKQLKKAGRSNAALKI
jgi:ATP-dependent exoDNAse (exonuclease V), alpha subunit - helicase superfamily I member